MGRKLGVQTLHTVIVSMSDEKQAIKKPLRALYILHRKPIYVYVHRLILICIRTYGYRDTCTHIFGNDSNMQILLGL